MAGSLAVIIRTFCFALSELGNLWDVQTQGGARRLALPWAILFCPFRVFGKGPNYRLDYLP